MQPASTPPVTPDGRYIVVRGRLWRRADPTLSDDEREQLTRALMRARREIRRALEDGNGAAEKRARQRAHAAKLALGERGPVWWDDGSPDLNRRLADNTPYATWYASVRRS
ncbi:hypothetical protein [Lysobacter sp. TY2-98]|uniref:hypothetical protein n=1 Tax=Lysobacter sp. TY2-98 TaxID=2290922 RepID=UPI001962CE65|nr:hypothetical protein [Lysobacter sp. TY2-98]